MGSDAQLASGEIVREGECLGRNCARKMFGVKCLWREIVRGEFTGGLPHRSRIRYLSKKIREF